MNLYLYGRASPVVMVDPNGMQEQEFGPGVITLPEVKFVFGEDEFPEDLETGQSIDTSIPGYATSTEDPPLLPPGWVSVGGGEGGAGPASQGEQGGPGFFPQEVFFYNKDDLGQQMGLMFGSALAGAMALPEILGLGGAGAVAGGGTAATSGGVLSFETGFTLNRVVAALTESIQLPHWRLATATVGGAGKASGAFDEAGSEAVGTLGKLWQSFTTGASSGAKTAELTDLAKTILRAEAREIWETRMGQSAGAAGLQVHHRIPLEWAHLFPTANPNRAANLIGVNPQLHGRITAAWNSWRASLKGRTPSPAEVMGFASGIDQAFGDQMKFLQ